MKSLCGEHVSHKLRGTKAVLRVEAKYVTIVEHRMNINCVVIKLNILTFFRCTSRVTICPNSARNSRKMDSSMVDLNKDEKKSIKTWS